MTFPEGVADMYADFHDALWPISILLAEHEPLARVAAAEVLRDRGFTVIEAANSDEAVTYYDAADALDLVVTVAALPGSLSGLEFARLVVAREPLMPVIIASAEVFLGDVDDFRFVRKPYSTPELVALITKTLGVQRRVDNAKPADRSSHRG